jgi:2,5-diamino-6-(ribosylamino)-4(3H)-pyrimidinone 5'-phosphate reductase
MVDIATNCDGLARHLPPRPATEERYHLPRPVILDSYLRLSPNCKLLKNFQNGTGRRPWIICSSSAISAESLHRKELENAGAKIIELAEVGGMKEPLLLHQLLLKSPIYRQDFYPRTSCKAS